MVDDPPIHDTKAISFTGRSKQHEDRFPRGVAVSTAAIALLVSLGAADAQQSDGSEALACDDSIANAMADIANTDVLLVKSFQQGEPLLLAAEGAPAATVVEGAPNSPVPVAGTDLCLVKLFVGREIQNPREHRPPRRGSGSRCCCQVLIAGTTASAPMATAAGPARPRRAFKRFMSGIRMGSWAVCLSGSCEVIRSPKDLRSSRFSATGSSEPAKPFSRRSDVARDTRTRVSSWLDRSVCSPARCRYGHARMGSLPSKSVRACGSV